MTAKSFSKVLTQLSKLLEQLTEDEIAAVAESTAQLVLTIEVKGQSRKVGATSKKATKAALITPQQMAENLSRCNTRQEALTILEDSKYTGPRLKELLVLMKLPTNGDKAALSRRIVEHVGSRADAGAIRGER